MSHLRRALKLHDRVVRIDDPRHVGVVLTIFKFKKYDEWTCNVQWIESRFCEYVPMDMLIHADDRT
jgi:hypothetical protein